MFLTVKLQFLHHQQTPFLQDLNSKTEDNALRRHHSRPHGLCGSRHSSGWCWTFSSSRPFAWETSGLLRGPPWMWLHWCMLDQKTIDHIIVLFIDYCIELLHWTWLQLLRIVGFSAVDKSTLQADTPDPNINRASFRSHVEAACDTVSIFSYGDWSVAFPLECELQSRPMEHTSLQITIFPSMLYKHSLVISIVQDIANRNF